MFSIHVTRQRARNPKWKIANGMSVLPYLLNLFSHTSRGNGGFSVSKVRVSGIMDDREGS